MDSHKTIIEAVLFAATSPMRPSEIAEKIGLSESDVRYALKDLKMDYNIRDSALMISEAAGEYRMMLRPDYNKYTDLVARPMMSPGVMRTLVTIAYNQPVLQSKLVSTRGPRAYEDVQKLIEMDLIDAKISGPTKELTTTVKFSEQFGIGSTKKNDIRKWIEEHMKSPSE
ncbi:MAG: SMC-Scp complex subunit ScpB [archaeon]|nr:SMC-Scp complex subunit ScpB [archaeon]